MNFLQHHAGTQLILTNVVVWKVSHIGLQIVVHDNFLKNIWSVSILNKDGSASAWFPKNHVIKSLPVGDNAISVGKFCDYHNHPYSI